MLQVRHDQLRVRTLLTQLAQVVVRVSAGRWDTNEQLKINKGCPGPCPLSFLTPLITPIHKSPVGPYSSTQTFEMPQSPIE